jgi:hypothetical protein
MKQEKEFNIGNISRLSQRNVGGVENILNFSLIKPLDSTSQWQISQYLKELSQREGLKALDGEMLENLATEIKQLRKEIDKNNEMLSISNDLLLELIGILNTQEKQSYFWTESWMEAERNAEEDIKNRKIHTFETADQIIDFLRSSEK